MKVTIKGIVKESEDKKDRYYDKVSKVIRPPYFVDLISLGIESEEWDKIFTKLYKQPVRTSSFYRSEQITGGVVTDKETNILYYEGDSGDYIMREFDKNNNVTYLFKTDGRGNDYWEKSIFNDQGESVYYENSNGKVSDVRDPNEINESMYSDKLIDKILDTLKPPYFLDLLSLGIPSEEWDKVFTKLYKQPVRTSSFYFGDVLTGGMVKDKVTNILYMEGENGVYTINEFDKNNNITFKLTVDGRGKEKWTKWKWDDKSECTYYEDSDGTIQGVDNINESMYSDKLIDKILDTLKPPFRYDLESLGIPRDEWDGIISKVFNEDLMMKDIVDAIYVTNIYGEPRYMESRNGNYFIDEYDDHGNVIYKESNYPNSGTPTYKEWFTYDDGKLIDYKDSNGRGLDQYLKSSEYLIRKDVIKKRR